MKVYHFWHLSLSCMLLFACSNYSKEHRVELEKVLKHYAGNEDKRKYDAALFLINSIGNKHYYKGKILDNYMPIFDVCDSVLNAEIVDRRSMAIPETWDRLVKEYGHIDFSELSEVYDYSVLSADFIIKNIEDAFMAWESSPFYNPDDFNVFCEYILPYKVADEQPEEYRERYYNHFKHIIDTVSSFQGLIHGFGYELVENLGYLRTNVLRNYPVDLPISLMEKAKGGSCRHMAILEASAMRACGIPVTIDEAIWVNRSQGHTWNVIVSDTGKVVAFDALDEMPMAALKYKPAKIFRKRNSRDLNAIEKMNPEDIPLISYFIDDEDVTHEYTQTFDISVPITNPYKGDKAKKNGVICTFDNQNWRVVFWGEIKSGKMHFKNMASDALYLAAFYDKGRIIPAALPFTLDNEGKIEFYKTKGEKHKDMLLYRKYPELAAIEDWATCFEGAVIEGANNPKYDNAVELKRITEKSFGVADSLITNPSKFRYVRIFYGKENIINLAEIEFYGKKSKDAQEEKLTGEFSGEPSLNYLHAIDGNLETYFSKSNTKLGWVGLDLGKGNEHIITRVRICPRSDTNFILEGDTYELFYWDKNSWQSAGIQIAPQYNFIRFSNVPSDAVFLLRNHTRGKEERIFTYEDGKQVWW